MLYIVHGMTYTILLTLSPYCSATFSFFPLTPTILCFKIVVHATMTNSELVLVTKCLAPLGGLIA